MISLSYYHWDVDQRDRVGAEEAEILQDVLINWGDCSLIFVQDEANHGADAHADQEGEEHDRILHHQDSSLRTDLATV